MGAPRDMTAWKTGTLEAEAGLAISCAAQGRRAVGRGQAGRGQQPMRTRPGGAWRGQQHCIAHVLCAATLHHCNALSAQLTVRLHESGIARIGRMRVSVLTTS